MTVIVMVVVKFGEGRVVFLGLDFVICIVCANERGQKLHIMSH